MSSKKRSNKKHVEGNKNKYNILKSMRCSKVDSEKEDYSKTGLPQKNKKMSPKESLYDKHSSTGKSMC